MNIFNIPEIQSIMNEANSDESVECYKYNSSLLPLTSEASKMNHRSQNSLSLRMQDLSFQQWPMSTSSSTVSPYAAINSAFLSPNPESFPWALSPSTSIHSTLASPLLGVKDAEHGFSDMPSINDILKLAATGEPEAQTPHPSKYSEFLTVPNLIGDTSQYSPDIHGLTSPAVSPFSSSMSEIYCPSPFSDYHVEQSSQHMNRSEISAQMSCLITGCMDVSVDQKNAEPMEKVFPSFQLLEEDTNEGSSNNEARSLCNSSDNEYSKQPDIGGQLRHKKRSNPNHIYVCHYKKCQKSFKMIEERTIHLSEHHSLSRPYECNDCSFRFALKRDLKRHVLFSHDEKMKFAFVCHVCSTRFSRDDALKRHYSSRYHQKREAFYNQK